jgi:C1A family cysteine protease
MQTTERKMGWLPDLPDSKDFVYKAAPFVKLPVNIDLSARMPEVYDQGQLGSCVGNAVAAAIDFCLIKQGIKPIAGSRLFVYYNARKMRGWEAQDSGCFIRDAIKSVNKLGICPENVWPYIPPKFPVQPSTLAFQAADQTKVLGYERINSTDLNALKSCLASGFPFVFGFSVYDAFQSSLVAESGKLNIPIPSEKARGGHAVLCVGYNDKTKRFIVRNSWGKSWGKAGYFSMPYEYLTNLNLADDFWKISLI